MNSRARDIALACLLPVLVFVVCRALSASWYDVDLSGIPDEGPVPAGLLPWFLHAYRLGGDVWSDPIRIRTWCTACAGYFIPVLVATAAPRRALAQCCGLVVALGLVIGAVVAIPTPAAAQEYSAYFTVSTVRSARLWIGALGIAGLGAGLVTRLATAAVRLSARWLRRRGE